MGQNLTDSTVPYLLADGHISVGTCLESYTQQMRSSIYWPVCKYQKHQAKHALTTVQCCQRQSQSRHAVLCSVMALSEAAAHCGCPRVTRLERQAQLGIHRSAVTYGRYTYR
jgi:hypothetical protein